MAQESARGTLDRLFNGLQSDSQRLIKVFIGDTERPIQIQQSILEHTSSYFIGAFRRDSFEESLSGTLRLPEDSVEVWKVLTNWIFRREVPEAILRGDLLLSIRCWITGDKYDIKEFQDAIMRCMLTELDPANLENEDGITIKLTLEMVQEAFKNTAHHCPLRWLVVERKILEYDELQPVDSDQTMDELKALDGSGFLSMFVHQKEALWIGDICSFIFCETSRKREMWKDYMVGSAST